MPKITKKSRKMVKNYKPIYDPDRLKQLADKKTKMNEKHLE